MQGSRFTRSEECAMHRQTPLALLAVLSAFVASGCDRRQEQPRAVAPNNDVSALPEQAPGATPAEGEPRCQGLSGPALDDCQRRQVDAPRQLPPVESTQTPPPDPRD